MFIKWYGLSSFLLKSKEATVITDPYSKKVGLKSPPLKNADLITLSAEVEMINSSLPADPDQIIISEPGEFEIKNILIAGSSAKTISTKEAAPRENIIFTFRIENINIGHLGFLGKPLSSENIEILTGVDILFVPIGGQVTIETEKALDIISTIEPRLVIPMTYQIPKLSLKLAATAQFCQEFGVSPKETIPKLQLKKSDLPSEETKVVLLEPQG